MAEITSASLAKLLDRLYQDYTKTEANRDQRYGSGLSDLASVVGLFGPGYGAGMEKTALAGANQSLIGRGLGGTTRPGAVSAGIKMNIEDLRRGKIAEALTRTAEYKRMFPESTATAGILSHLATGGFSAGINAPPQISGTTLGPMASQGLNVFGQPMSGSSGGVSAPNFQSPTTTNVGGSSGTTQSAGQSVSGAGGTYYPPREYDPSMVGKSMWAQQGSQVSTTGLPISPVSSQTSTSGSFDAGGRKVYGSILEGQKAGPGSLVLKGSTYYEITSTGTAKRVGYA